MTCYTNSLNKNPPNTHRVQKCLQKLLRSMHKDRHHTIQHYRHLLETNFEQVSHFPPIDTETKSSNINCLFFSFRLTEKKK